MGVCKGSCRGFWNGMGRVDGRIFIGFYSGLVGFSGRVWEE